MRFAPQFAVFTIAAGLVGFSSATGQPPDKAAKADPDLERLQGEWVVTGLELPPDHEVPPPEFLKGLSITVRGSLVMARLTRPDGKAGEPAYHLIALDSTKTPRTLDTINSDEKARALRLHTIEEGGRKVDAGPWYTSRGIYKFEGDKLVICASDNAGAPRPTEFKARWSREPKTSPPYGVVSLTKKK